MRNKKGSFLMIGGLLLIVAALFLTGYNLYDNYRASRLAGAAVEQLDIVPVAEVNEAPDIDTEIVVPDYVLNPDMEMPVKEIDGWSYIGILEVPSCELELPVISEWSYPALKAAPCRYSGSAYQDNMVIAAHNYRSHFSKVKRLSVGAEVIFTDIDGNVFEYEVAELETLEPTAIKEMTSGDWELTLFTCTSGGQYRVAVRCRRKEKIYSN